MKGITHVVVQGLGHVYDTNSVPLTALDGVDLELERGHFLSVIGPTGSGKTTFLKALGALIKPTSGTVKIDGASSIEAQHRKQISFVFQDPTLLPWRTVNGNIGLPMELINHSGLEPRSLDDLLQMVGLTKFKDYYPYQLSVGMKQRVAFARALVSNPTLLLMDEPLAALDEITRSLMRYELLRIWENSGRTVILVTHSIPEAVIMSDKIAVMSSRPGKIVENISIELPRPRDDSTEASTAFAEHVNRVRESLATAMCHGPN